MSDFKITEIKCEYRKNPIGISTRNPRFSWKIQGKVGTRLTAFQVCVFDKNGVNMWDSHRVEDEKYFAVVYAGKPLEILHRYTYMVTLWDNKGNCVTSDEQFFETGFFSLTDWKTKWITAKEAAGPMHIRADFTVKGEISSARLYAATTTGAFKNMSFGINTVYLTLNGKKVGEDCFTPGQLSEKKWRALYRTYDISDMLCVGKNALGGVILSMAFGAYITVTYTDGNVDTFTFDENFKTNGAGPYRVWEDGVEDQGGKREDYNALKEFIGFDMPGFDDSDWSASVLTDVVRSLEEQTVITNVIESLAPVSITKKGYIHYVVDFGQNINGHIRLTVRNAGKGRRISVRYGESLHENGEINPYSTINYQRGENGPHTDTYIPRGDVVEVYEPRFANHGFRYVDIINYPGQPKEEDIYAQLVHSDILDNSGFSCSDEDINKLFHISYWSQRDNLMSIPTDCPHRERHGWMGDALVVSESECINFDLIKFYESWCRNMADDQTESGNVQYISPFQSPLINEKIDVPWSAACVYIPWFVYQVYGDDKVLKQSYPMMTRWIEFMDTLADSEHILHGGIRWNDHTARKGMNTDWLGTLYYYGCCDIMSKIADVLGNTADSVKYFEKAKCIRVTLRNNFKKDDTFADSLQSDLAHAICMGITDEAEKEQLARRLNNLIESDDGFLTCGALGIFFAIPALSNNGYNDTVFKICKDKREGSFGGWIANHDATTAFEYLNYSEWVSKNHPFLMGSITNWFYECLVGIHRTSPGYKNFVINPYIPKELTWAQGKIDTLYGCISVRWEKNGGKIIYTVNVPCGTCATLIAPSGREITLESGTHIVTL